MTNYTELRKAAEKHKGKLFHVASWGRNCPPSTILALLDEREKLLKVAEAAKKEQFKSRGLREAIEELEK